MTYTDQDVQFLQALKNKGVSQQEAFKRLEAVKAKLSTAQGVSQASGLPMSGGSVEVRNKEDISKLPTEEMRTKISEEAKSPFEKVGGFLKGTYETGKEAFTKGVEGANQMLDAAQATNDPGNVYATSQAGRESARERTLDVAEGSQKVIAGALGTVFSPAAEIIKESPAATKVVEGIGKGFDFISTGLSNVFGAGLDDEEKNIIKEGWNNYFALVGIQKGPQKAQQLAEKMSETLPGLKEQMTPVIKETVGAVKDEARQLYQAITTKSPEQVDAFITQKFEKGVRPSGAGKGTSAQLEQYQNKAIGAVKTIVENKPNLKLVNEYGEATGKLPQNLNEFTQAVDQTKAQIYKKYDALQKSAGETGAMVDLVPIAKELDQVAASKVLQDVHPEVVKYAQDRSKAFAKRSAYTTEQAQEAIKIYNDSLQAFYKNPAYDTASKVAIDSLVVNNLRKGLDSTIESTGGAGYQALKNQYGALKSIEKDVVHRAVVDARKNNKSMIDFTDVFTAGDMIHGLATLNPATFGVGVTGKAIAMYYKYLNNPNTAIKQLFNGVEKAQTQMSLPKLNSQAAKNIPRSPNTIDIIDTTIPKIGDKSIKQTLQTLPATDIATGLLPAIEKNMRADTPKIKIQEELIKSGSAEPVPVTQKADGTFVLNKDGFHRFMAYKNLGIDKIPVEIQAPAKSASAQQLKSLNP